MRGTGEGGGGKREEEEERGCKMKRKCVGGGGCRVQNVVTSFVFRNILSFFFLKGEEGGGLHSDLERKEEK